MSRAVAVATLNIIACATPSPATTTTPAPIHHHPSSTTADRDRARAIVHDIEQHPLNPTAEEQSDRDWLFHWLGVVPDLGVIGCNEILGPVEDVQRYDYGILLARQVLYGQLVYEIDHPGVKESDRAVYVAGLRSAFAAYRSILATDPTARWASIDQLMERDDLDDDVARRCR